MAKYVLPGALKALKANPSHLDELLVEIPGAQDALIRVAVSTRSLAQALLARTQDLLGHARGNAELQTKVAVGLLSVLSDDANQYAGLSTGLTKGLAVDRRLAQWLLRDATVLLQQAKGNPALEGVLAEAILQLAVDSVAFRNGLRVVLHRDAAWRLGVLGDIKVFASLISTQGGSNWNRLEAWAQWHVFVEKMRPWLASDGAVERLAVAGLEQLGNPQEQRGVFYGEVCGAGELPLRLGRLQLPDDHSFWPQLFEIFVREDYAFEARTAAPRIIDAGMHMGLATYYFKAKYPDAVVTAFEPSQELRAVAEENVRRCGFRNVTVEPYALYKEDATLTFHLDADDTMAGSVLAGHHAEDAHRAEAKVEARRLSPYLQEPVDYLKLDIEGAEGGVLEECRGMLRNVDHLFIEYHEGHARELNSLPAILAILDEAGFDYEVSKSHGYQLLTEHHPMQHVGKPYSAIVWAKNRAWPHAGAV